MGTFGAKGVYLVKKMEHIRDAIEGFMGSAGLKRKYDRKRCLYLWPTVVGPEIAVRTHPCGIRGGVMTVEVADAVWAQELSYHKRRILESFRERVGRSAPRDLRFILAKDHRATAPRPFQERQQRSETSNLTTLTRMEEEAIKSACERIEDPTVRNLLLQIIRWQRRFHQEKLC